MAALTERAFEGRMPLRAALAAAGAGVLGCALGAAGWPRQLLFSYLTAFAYVVTLQLGALLFLMTAHLANVRWTMPLRRVNEAIAASLAAGPLLFLPILVGAAQLYPWVDAPPHGRALAFLPAKGAYLNLPAFALRALLYFAIWIALAWRLRRASAAREAGNPEGRALALTVSAAGMPLLSLSLTFAAFDWIMSLEPEWFSTMFGIYWFAGGFVGAIALLTVVAHAADRSGWLAGLLNGSHYYALGRLLLAFTIFWAYIAYFQFFLIYIANRPEEVTYFVRRSAGSWFAFGIALIILHFVLPFGLLLLRWIKFRPELLGAVAGWLLFVHYLDVYWLVMPVLQEHGVRPHWLDLAALLVVAGVAAAVSLWLLRGRPLGPHGDPELALAARYRSS